MKLIAIGNVVVMEYLLMTHYQVPHKWAWLVLTACVLTALLFLTQRKRD